ncbi:MAG: hypothetical protein ACRC1T_09545 [Clostridium chrysemydis]|uniref:hypothetical protein n=1 Tax=Clostridium chrysemydis TaxID=2665504 RepID=UPI003F2D34EE
MFVSVGNEYINKNNIISFSQPKIIASNHQVKDINLVEKLILNEKSDHLWVDKNKRESYIVGYEKDYKKITLSYSISMSIDILLVDSKEMKTFNETIERIDDIIISTLENSFFRKEVFMDYVGKKEKEYLKEILNRFV